MTVGESITQHLVETKHEGRISAVAMNKDRLIASVSTEGTHIRFIKPPTLITVLRENVSNVSNGDRTKEEVTKEVAEPEYAYERKWHIETGCKKEISSISFSPCGKYLATSCFDMTVKVFNVGRKQLVNKIIPLRMVFLVNPRLGASSNWRRPGAPL